MKTKIT